jgi:hypothetical protein
MGSNILSLAPKHSDKKQLAGTGMPTQQQDDELA